MNPVFTAPSLARRMACWLYEGMLVFGVVFVAGCIYFIFGGLFGTMSPNQSINTDDSILQAYLFVILGIYFVWLWAKGQTLAMKTWNITVVNRFGRPITQAQALLRYVLSWLWFLPALAAIAPFHLSGTESVVIVIGWVVVWAVLSRFHPEQQFWHDALAGTRLIAKPRLSKA